MSQFFSRQFVRLRNIFEIYIVRNYQLARLRRNVRWICGPQDVRTNERELIVVCVVQNGELYINSFINHYQSLGVSQIILLENGSSDQTIEIAGLFSDVTVLSTNLPFKHYKHAMRAYLIKRYGQARWVLCVDIDELFDYPYSAAIDLPNFLEYLNQNSFNAVVAHMLDMFSDEPLGQIESDIEDDLKERFRFFDLSDLTRMGYFYRNETVSHLEIYFGGIRRTVFGSEALIISKHPLVKPEGRMIPIYPDEHGVRNARVADVTCVLYHYKFIGGFYARAERSAREENYYRNSMEYKRFLQVLKDQPELRLKRETSRYLEDPNELIENGFLQVSGRYLDWVTKISPVLEHLS